MKFGKRLRSQLEESLPEWRDKYLSYKQLKKRLKQLSAPPCFTEAAALSSPEHVKGGAIIPHNEASIALSRIAENGSLPGNVLALSEGQDSSINGGSIIGTKSSSGSAGGAASDCLHPDWALMDLSAEEADFVHLLNAELEKFNTFFVEKEEEYVIQLQELKERCEKLKERRSPSNDMDSNLDEEMINIRKEIVNFHGEMVLLENYSSLNYTGLVKILKKHDKRTGALLRMSFIRSVLHQPFFTTELLSKLVRECEMNLQSLFPQSEAGEVPAAPAVIAKLLEEKANATTGKSQKHEVQERKNGNADVHNVVVPVFGIEQTHCEGEDVDSIYKSTLAALRTIKELRRGSSTYSIFSLPPFNKGEDDDVVIAPCITMPLCVAK